MPRSSLLNATFPLLVAAILSAGCAHRPPTDPVLARGEELFLRTPTAAPKYVPTSRLACGNCHSHPGRVVWLVFNVAIAIILMELGIYKALEHTLGLYANIAVAWVGTLAADLVINKPLGLSPRHIEFKRAHLYDINPVGVGAMLIASLVSITAYADVLGDTARAMAPFIALGTALVVSPLIALATGGRFYIAREPSIPAADRSLTSPSVSVPVLSEQRTSMLPKFSIAASCFTITRSRAIRLVPCASVMPMIAGRSCGVRPTARASANSAESITGRWK